MTVYETVEYNAAKDLLIVRNPSRGEPDEHVLLSKSGWIEIPLDEVADILPPTPGHRSNFHLPLKHKDSSVSQLEDSSAQLEDSKEASAIPFSKPKRVYKRAPVVSNLHTCCD